MCAVRAHIFCVGPIIRTLNLWIAFRSFKYAPSKNVDFSPNAFFIKREITNTILVGIEGIIDKIMENTLQIDQFAIAKKPYGNI